jgi:hypothetical protein
MDNSIWQFQIQTHSTIQQKSAIANNYSVVLYNTTIKVTEVLNVSS